MQALCWCAVLLIPPKTAATQAKRFATLVLHNPQERPNCPTPKLARPVGQKCASRLEPSLPRIISAPPGCSSSLQHLLGPRRPASPFPCCLANGSSPALEAHGHAFADSISSLHEHLSDEATRTWRSRAKGVATANIAVTPVRVNREMWVQERVQHRISA